MVGSAPLQTTTGQETVLQSSLHPMATGGSYIPPSPMTAQSMSLRKPAEISVRISNLSLFSIILSLILLGLFTFLGGFFLGMWVSGPSTPYGMGPPLEKLQPSADSLPSAPSYVAPQSKSVTQTIGEQAGKLVQSTASTPIPGVPTFLQPLVSATQAAEGKQLGSKAQKAIESYTQPSTPSPSSAPSAPATAPSAPATAPQVIPHSQTKASSLLSQQPQLVSQGANGNYTIQLGVFATKENAQDLVNRLQGINYISQISEGKNSEGSPIYYVHSGAYKDYTKAQEAATQFVSQGIPGAIVVDVSSANNKNSS